MNSIESSLEKIDSDLLQTLQIDAKPTGSIPDPLLRCSVGWFDFYIFVNFAMIQKDYFEKHFFFWPEVFLFLQNHNGIECRKTR